MKKGIEIDIRSGQQVPPAALPIIYGMDQPCYDVTDVDEVQPAVETDFRRVFNVPCDEVKAFSIMVPGTDNSSGVRRDDVQSLGERPRRFDCG